MDQSIQNPMSPRAHVLMRQGPGSPAQTERTHAQAHAQFRGENVVGRTPNAIVYSDGSPNGDAAAQAVLASVEADYGAVRDWFGGLTLPAGQEGDDQTTPRTATPVQILIDPQAGGAYHFGCTATDFYIAPDPQQATGLFVAELVEVFEAAINNGWSCGQANGEALSRALAVERNGNLAGLIADTARQWWANGHTDFVTNNSADDRNQDSNGCGTLFLYYLHSQLGYSWQKIATTGGASLGECYQRLTGNDPSQGFQDYITALSTLATGDQLALPENGNPFPINGVSGGNGSSGSASTGTSGGGARMGLLLAIAVVLVILGVLTAAGVIHLG